MAHKYVHFDESSEDLHRPPGRVKSVRVVVFDQTTEQRRGRRACRHDITGRQPYSQGGTSPVYA